MLSLQDLLGAQQGEEAVEQIASNVGADRSMVTSAISAALPAILSGLANNAATPAGAQSLNAALDEDHSGGGVLGDLSGLAGAIFGGGGQAAAPAPSRQVDAGGILGHIFGDSQGAVAQDVSQKSGLGIGQVAQIIMMLAPIVMSYLGREKQQQNVGAEGLGGLLGGLLGQQQAQPASSGNAAIDMASAVLDRDRDGSAMDDIASMAFDYMRNRQ